MTAPQLLSRLEGVKAEGEGRWMARCPCPIHAHGDRKQSLGISIGEKGLLLKCRAGGETVVVLSLLGLTMKDLFFEKKPSPSRSSRETFYPYCDEGGEMLYQVVRLDLPEGKRIFQRRPDPTQPGGWNMKLGNVRRVPYRLPELLAVEGQQPVFIVEGEKNADDLVRQGLVATTNPQGAGKWLKDFNQFFRGRHVVILPDNDPPGLAHGVMVARHLHQVATSVKVLDLPGLSEKGDVSDWLGAGGTASQLLALGGRCPTWTPQAERAAPEPEREVREKTTQAQLLVRLARETSELFRTEAGEAFAIVEKDNTWPVRSAGFRLFLADRFFSVHDRPVTGQALKEAVDTLLAIASRNGRTEIVALRVGEHEDKIYIDLCDDDHRIVEIRPGKWRITHAREVPIRFRRSSTARPLPQPKRGRSVEEIRRFVNTGPDEWRWRLVLTWVLYTMQPRGPFPPLVLQGQQGSAKSTTARVLRALVDPSQAPLRLPPKDEDKLLIAAKGSWMLVYDNLSGMPSWLSDGLCCLATGTAYTKRSLYTDDDEHVIEAIRPVVINGIDDMTARPDFASRALSIELPPIAEQHRREEADFWSDFSEAQPYLVGALCDALAAILAARHKVTLSCRPRMADFARFGVAAEVALGWDRGSFLAAYQESQADSSAVALESDLVAYATTKFMQQVDLPSWRGTSTELLPRLTAMISPEQAKSRSWPTTASQLGNSLMRIVQVLHDYGTDLSRLRSRGQRIVVLTRITDENGGERAPPAVTPAQSQQPPTVASGGRVALLARSVAEPSGSDAHQGDSGWRQGDRARPTEPSAEGDEGDGCDAPSSFRSEKMEESSDQGVPSIGSVDS